jgi:hypothetical protein
MVMKLDDILTERWQKGHLTSNQMVQSVQHYIGNNGTVKRLPKDDKDGVAQIDMLPHVFLDMFGAKGSSDKILQLMSTQINKPPKVVFDQYGYKNIVKNNNTYGTLFSKILKRAVVNARKIVPNGWLLYASFDMISPTSLTSEHPITMYIKRDHTQEMSRESVYYHVTKAANFNSIMQKGLVPSDNKRLSFDGYRNRIHLLVTKPEMEFVDHLINGSVFGSTENPQIVIFQVHLPLDIKTYDDNDMKKEAVFVEQTIEPQYLKVWYNGPLHDIPY